MSVSPVSPTTEQALRAAMERLFAGAAQHTDGKLTKNNLWREAGVSRATMNRAPDILAEWDRRVGESPAQGRQQQQDEALATARSQLRQSRDESRRLQEQLDAAATVIASLLAENAALRAHQASRSATVTQLSNWQATRE